MRIDKIALVSVVVLIQLWWSCDGCWENERLAFLQLHDSFKSYFSWNMSATNCCEWERIECDANTGRVTYLDLNDARDWLSDSRDNFLINASLFLPFQQLRFLDLSLNGIHGCHENEGFERLKGLNNLEYLDLSGNYFNNSILSSLNSLTSLKSLNISFNRLKGAINVGELNKFKTLKELNLCENEIEELIAYDGAKLRLKSLERLEMRANRFSNNVLSSLEELSNLKVLDVGYNRIRGSLNLTNLAGMKKLKELYLSGNNIKKFVTSRDLKIAENLKTVWLDDMSWTLSWTNLLLKSLGAFPHVKTLNLGSNNLTGTTFYREFQGFTNVEDLQLRGSIVDENFVLSLNALPSLKSFSYGYDFWTSNRDAMYLNQTLSLLNGGAIFKAVGRIHTLETLELSDIKYIGFGRISALQLQDLCHMKLLRSLVLPGIFLSDSLPSCLSNLTSLQHLDLSSNYLRGRLPEWLANMSSLRYLDMSFNLLEGNISASLLNQLTSIQDLRLGDNQFQIPMSLLPFYNSSNFKTTSSIQNNNFYADLESHDLVPKFQLEDLWLVCDGCGGVFPKFLYHQHNLQYVILENVNLKGEFPFWLLENNTELESLFLSNNSLSGSIKIPNHMKLSILIISTNGFNGQIPEEIGSKLPRLSYLDMSSNNFDGIIPSSLGNLRRLTDLDLSNNKLSKELPNYFKKKKKELPNNLTMELQSLLLSNNSLEGQIFWKIMKLKKLEYIRLGGNQFNGTIPDSHYNWSSVKFLDVNNNQLSGGIPNWLGSMKFLQVLDLSRNKFMGRIPGFLGASQLAEVYLSNNMLNGSFLHAFSNCSGLTTLDLSHNFLVDTFTKWQGNFPNLTFLLLSHNNLAGEIPDDLCKLKLSLIDLSNNNISGHIPRCLRSSSILYRENPSLSFYHYISNGSEPKQQLEFTTKSISYSYKGSILNLLRGIDLSCNKLTGEIPPGLGNLSSIRVLNLSHNSLKGPIPSTFSNLEEIESLDLSNNNLEGNIPPQLVQLNSISFFSVAYNNLSGKTPDMVKQFATFENTSYQGNRFLCGKPLSRSCEATESLSSPPGFSANNDEEDAGFMDMGVFYVSFVVSYIVLLLGTIAVLYINPHWRRTWFRLAEIKMVDCYYFVVDNCPRLFNVRV